MLLLIIGLVDTDEKADLDHDQNLRNLLDRCRTTNIKLKKEKLQLKCSEVSFIGHVMTRSGLKADPKKVEAIIKFLQDLSELCESLRRLRQKKAEWNWTHEQEDAFEKIKDAVSKVPVLKFFSESDPTEG